ncbi:MAG: spore photoproduct lyase family protein, partial [Candidatus Omnitrophota bacterium]
QEIVRLVFEIAKREQIASGNILEEIRAGDFTIVKKTLLFRRYPAASLETPEADIYLPKLEPDPSAAVAIGRHSFYPRNIYIEKEALNTSLVERAAAAFPRAKRVTIGSLKEFMRRADRPAASPENPGTVYNHRTENLFLTRERHDFLKECPCTARALGCGYRVWNIGFGCAHECVYCFLQEYQNIPGIIIPVNLDDFFSRFRGLQGRGIFSAPRIGTGEFTDSLLFDRLTGFSGEIIDFFKRYPGVDFEFKTKSTCVESILERAPQKNIVVSWSINPQRIIDANEFYAAGLAARIRAAADCAKAGWRVGFHFDPIIYDRDSFAGYREAVDSIFDSIPEKSVAWISLGTLRFSPALKKIIENRFPYNTLLDGELVLGFDRKMRYPESVRVSVYRSMLQAIRRRSKKVFLYLCMEDRRVWKAVAPLNCVPKK